MKRSSANAFNTRSVRRLSAPAGRCEHNEAFVGERIQYEVGKAFAGTGG